MNMRKIFTDLTSQERGSDNGKAVQFCTNPEQSEELCQTETHTTLTKRDSLEPRKIQQSGFILLLKYAKIAYVCMYTYNSYFVFK